MKASSGYQSVVLFNTQFIGGKFKLILLDQFASFALNQFIDLFTIGNVLDYTSAGIVRTNECQSFLKHTIRILGLENTVAMHGRLEALGRQAEYRGTFDTVICRAFSSLADFTALTAEFLAPGGCLVALKGPQTDHPEEAAACECGETTIQLGGEPFFIRVHRYTLPILDSQRRLVKIAPLREEG